MINTITIIWWSTRATRAAKAGPRGRSSWTRTATAPQDTRGRSWKNFTTARWSAEGPRVRRRKGSPRFYRWRCVEVQVCCCGITPAARLQPCRPRSRSGPRCSAPISVDVAPLSCFVLYSFECGSDGTHGCGSRRLMAFFLVPPRCGPDRCLWCWPWCSSVVSAFPDPLNGAYDSGCPAGGH